MSNINSLTFGENTIPRVKHVKYIGLILDEQLSWAAHIDEICKSLTKYFSVFYNLRRFISLKLARIIYYSCIYPRIKYGIEVYGATNTTKLKKIQTLQNKLMKILTNKNYLHGTNELHSELNILKVTDIYKLATLNFVYTSIQGDTIPKFRNYFTLREDTHEHGTRQRDHITTRKFNTENGRSTTQNMGAMLWNSLGVNERGSKSKNIFKKAIAKQLKAKYLNP